MELYLPNKGNSTKPCGWLFLLGTCKTKHFGRLLLKLSQASLAKIGQRVTGNNVSRFGWWLRENFALTCTLVAPVLAILCRGALNLRTLILHTCIELDYQVGLLLSKLIPSSMVCHKPLCFCHFC